MFVKCALPLLLSSVFLLAAPNAVRLDFGSKFNLLQSGWSSFPASGRSGLGPLKYEAEACSFAPQGFVVELGPAGVLGARSAKVPSDFHSVDPRFGMVYDSFFSPAKTPPVLTLSGLPPGEFRVILWFNDARGYQWDAVRVLTSDAKGGQRCSAAAVAHGNSPKSSAAGQADFPIFSNGRDPIKIEPKVPIAPGRKKYVFICGMEILPSTSAFQARLPNPVNRQRELACAPLRLSWIPAPGAASQKLLLGKNRETLALVAENPKDNAWVLEKPDFGETCFWRVDARVAGEEIPGELWQFSCKDGQAFGAIPAPGKKAVPFQTSLHWKLPSGASSASLWFGSNAETLHKQAEKLTENSWKLPGLKRKIRYFWRVDALHGKILVPGKLWFFETDGGGPRQPFPADGEQDVSANVRLRWTAGGVAQKTKLLVGTSPDALRERSGGETSFPFGTTLFWRVDETCDGEILPGPVWRFSVGNRLVVENFEGYADDASLGSCWKTEAGRATLSTDGLKALELSPEQGKVCVRRNFASPVDWKSCGASQLRLRCSAPGVLLLLDREGRQASFSLAPEKGQASIALDSVKNIDLRHIAGVTIESRSALRIDDLGLTSSGTTPVEKPQIGDFSAISGAPRSPEFGSVLDAELETDVCVVGGGSGGIGAALAAARAGSRVILVEREAILGGTSTSGYVLNWEPGPGCSFAREIAERLQKRKDGIVYSRAKKYDETLTRAGSGRLGFHAIPFSEVVMEMLAETGRVRVLLNTTFVRSARDRERKRVRWVDVVRNKERYRIRARVFVDCTGSGFLCQTLGCEAMLGADSRSRFQEPSAPLQKKDVLNAIELCYRIRKSPHPKLQVLPEGRKPRRGGAAWPLPGGDRFVNTCGGLAPGWLLMKLGYEGTRKELELRVQQHWHKMQKERYPNYEFDSYAPMLAIRESHRILGEYVLREQDVKTHISKASHPDFVAIADHPMDTHGSGGGLNETAAPYGIPYRCLLPKGPWQNLLIACRGASFSHLAASSCRLSRTIMALGHAAGLAAAESAQHGVGVAKVNVPLMQRQLEIPEK